MPRIEFKKKPRKDGSGLWTDKDGSQVFIGKDYAQQNDIQDAREKTKNRACYRECMSCGTCKNSARDSTFPYMYDDNEKKNINCITCEPYRYHDCNNGFMRDARGDAEPFTPDQIKLIKTSVDKKPLM